MPNHDDFAHRDEPCGRRHLFDPPFLIERCLWAIIFVAFFAMASYNVARTVQTYLELPVDTKVIAQRAANLTFPDATLCVTYKSKDFEKALNFSNAAHVRKLLERIAPKGVDVGKDIFVPAIQNLYEPLENRTVDLVMLTAVLLSRMIAPESGKFFHYIDALKNSTKGEKARKAENATFESLQAVYDFYVNRDFGFQYIYQMVGRLMWRALDADLDCYQELSSSRLSDWNVSWLSFPPGSADTTEYLCSKVPAKQMIAFSKGSDLCTIRMRTKVFSEQAEASSLTLDFDGDNILKAEPTEYWELKANQARSIKVHVVGDFSSLNSSTNPCYPYDKPSAQAWCRGVCLAVDTYKRRSCWPLSWSRLERRPEGLTGCEEHLVYENTTTPYPFEPVFTTARELVEETNHYIKLYDETCTALCPANCRQRLLSIESTLYGEQAKGDTSGPDAYAKIHLSVASFFYPEYVQQRSYDAAKLFADVGGCVGIWLGGSIIGLVVLYACRFAIAKICCGPGVERGEKRVDEASKRAFGGLTTGN